ncbi:MAG: hypothetical protein KKD36_15365 [Bacteroidetes bacterium]|nr:hypothetical protein [Bacteroidota bacterium]
MDGTDVIYQKLEAFIKKYYVNELLRGLLLFVGLGLLYFLGILFIEYFLWLKPLGRTVLFWFFLVVELFLFVRFICFPIFKLSKFSKGISYTAASVIIGDHFKEVDDKLLNFIQLNESVKATSDSDLLLASIDQKALDLKPIPFSNAVNFKANKKFFPVALIPVIVISLIYFSGNSIVISQSLNRVMNFKKEFLPPAPFKFIVTNSKLIVDENKDFVIRVKTVGSLVPENALISIDGESYFMENIGGGEFKYSISKPTKAMLFHFEANNVVSEEFYLDVVAVPSITNLVMELNYPSFLGRKNEVISGSGNAVVPEGTVVTWRVNAQSTQRIDMQIDNRSIAFSKNNLLFYLSKNISQNTEYQIVTSNSNGKKFEMLSYQLTVIKDQFPTINARKSPDSLKLDSKFVIGEVGDDYGVSKLQVVYYDHTKPSIVSRGTVSIKNGIFDQFVFAFPGPFPVKEGIDYDYYFEVFDNDAVHNFKSTRSTVFSARVRTVEETNDLILEEQNGNIKGLERSLLNQEKQFSQIERLQKVGKEKDNFDFNEQQKVKDFIQQQRKQDQMMRDFAAKLKDNLEKQKSSAKDDFKELLKKRIDKSADELDKNNKLLDELQLLNDKLSKEELVTKIDKFKQNSKNQSKNLQQLVELTKKFYVQKKTEQIANKLMNLAEKQDNLTENDTDNTVKNQNDINKDFDKLKQDLNDLGKDNRELRAPLDLGEDKNLEIGIDTDLEKSLNELSKDNKSKAKSNQKNASSKMKSLSKKMGESLESSDAEQMQEDIQMLRQVLDNLLAFSLAEEVVMKDVRNLNSGSPMYNKNIKKQQDLRLQFKHIDDSLFAVSLRNPRFTEDITKEVGSTQYNLDKAIESLSDSKIGKGLSHQQYVIAGANKLGDFLSGILSNMQMDLSSMSSGKPKSGGGQGMQLPDIIAKQKGLGDKLSKGIGKDGNSDGDKNGSSEGGKGDNASESDAREVMEIYKQQKELRKALDAELKKQGINGAGNGILENMKQIERDVLNRGFSKQTLSKVLNVNQELLKLKSALQTQGEENIRQSQVGDKAFNNSAKALPDALLEYLKSIEILNRQSLPLRNNYNRKVQEYFNKK